MRAWEFKKGPSSRIGAFVLIMFSIEVGLPILRATQSESQKIDVPAVRSERFEVASVRPVPEKEQGLTSISPLGEPRFTAHNATLAFLIGYAFDVDSGRQLLGEPKWLESEEYDISAKAENDKKLTYEELKPRLQQLLEERFHLAYHRETRVHKGYALAVAKGGPKLHPDTSGSQSAYILPDRIAARKVPLALLASLLARPMGAPVVDKTGIPGRFDFDLQFDPNNTTASRFPSLATALQEDLGLKLEREDVPEQVIVIDHVDRVPTEN